MARKHQLLLPSEAPDIIASAGMPSISVKNTDTPPSLQSSTQKFAGQYGNTAARIPRKKVTRAQHSVGFRPEWMRQRATPKTVRPFAGADALAVVDDPSYPWCCCGFVQNSEGSAGSGTLVGGRLLLTASHCIPWDTINSKGQWWLQFTPYFRSTYVVGQGESQTPFGSSFVSDVIAYENHDGADGPESQSQEALDYAVCRLFDPLGSNLGYLGSFCYNADWNGLPAWSNIAYPMAAGPFGEFNVSMLSSFTVDPDPGLIVEVNTLLIPGMSGSSFFGYFGSASTPGYYVTAVAVASSGTPPSYLSSGNEMVALIKQAGSQWPA